MSVNHPLGGNAHGELCAGVKYLNDCPVQPNLPVYLLVAGSMGLVRVLNLLWKQFRRRRQRKMEGMELDQEEETENSSLPTRRVCVRLAESRRRSRSRWIRFHRRRPESLPVRVVHRWTVLDVDELHAELRIRTGESEQVLPQERLRVRTCTYRSGLCDVSRGSLLSHCTDMLCHVSALISQDTALNKETFV